MCIHGLYLVKNEADIVRFSLSESVRWCDKIYVFDNGSTDGTWEHVQKMAATHPAIVPFCQDPCPFDDALRARIFHAFRHEAQPGDWWCRLDADEFYIDDPRAFLRDIPRSHHVVWCAGLLYYLTENDLERFTPSDESIPPEIGHGNLPRFYRAAASEARFFRHRSRLRWNGGAWPSHLGLVAPQRIRLKHFQYRSPAQIQRRLDTRREAAEAGWKHFDHSTQEHWREKIAKSGDLIEELPGETFAIDPAHLPRHLEPPWQRIVKRILHSTGIWP